MLVISFVSLYELVMRNFGFSKQNKSIFFCCCLGNLRFHGLVLTKGNLLRGKEKLNLEELVGNLVGDEKATIRNWWAVNWFAWAVYHFFTISGFSCSGLQSSQVKRTLVDSINESIVWKLNLLVVSRIQIKIQFLIGLYKKCMKPENPH